MVMFYLIHIYFAIGLIIFRVWPLRMRGSKLTPAACAGAPATVANAGSVAGCANTTNGGGCSVVCSAGFQLAGSYVCSSGTWTGAPTCSGEPEPRVCVNALVAV